jgi:hypothetical protein
MSSLELPSIPEPGPANWQMAHPGRETFPSRQAMPSPPETLAQVFSSFPSIDGSRAVARRLLPLPDELPPMTSGNDLLIALLWIGIIIICFVIPILLK